MPAEPKAQKLKLPKEYGTAKDKATLPWSYVDERMREAKHYWVCTVASGGQPHATPVDAIWVDGVLYFGGSTATRRHQNILANPKVCIHLESAADVVILRGEARELRKPDRDLCVRLAEASNAKYGYGTTPEQYAKTPGILAFRPRVVLAWKSPMKQATRWAMDQ